MPCCPVCSSDRVYPLLNTWRCKRCKYIWKTGGESACLAVTDASLKSRKRTEPLETRLEKRLEEILIRSGGKFCLTTMTWQTGDISQEHFRRFVRQCVKDRVLAETKDHSRRTWFSRPG